MDCLVPRKWLPSALGSEGRKPPGMLLPSTSCDDWVPEASCLPGFTVMLLPSVSCDGWFPMASCLPGFTGNDPHPCVVTGLPSGGMPWSAMASCALWLAAVDVTASPMPSLAAVWRAGLPVADCLPSLAVGVLGVLRAPPRLATCWILVEMPGQPGVIEEHEGLALRLDVHLHQATGFRGAPKSANLTARVLNAKPACCVLNANPACCVRMLWGFSDVIWRT